MLLSADNSFLRTDLLRCAAPDCDFGVTTSHEAFVAHLTEEHGVYTAAAHDRRWRAPAAVATAALVCAVCGVACAGGEKAVREHVARHKLTPREYR